eukprot:g2346.t1
MRMARAPGATFIMLASALLVSTAWGSEAISLPYPSLSVVEQTLLTTAADEFGGHAPAFEAAAKWDEERLRSSKGHDVRAPHLACTGLARGFEAFSRLQQLLSPEAVRPVSQSRAHGACFVATASHPQVAAIAADHDRFGLESLAPFPSALKLAPGVLEHEEGNRSGRLSARHGASMRIGDVDGLNVELSPGTLAKHPREAMSFVQTFLEDLMSESLDLHSMNFWSDPALGDGEHLASAGGAARSSDWSVAATLVNDLAKSGKTSPGDICSWDSVSVRGATDDVLMVNGLDHLLHSGRGAGGHNDEATELHVACFMGLVSFLASRQEVLRVAPNGPVRLLDATARAIIQTATPSQTPFTDAGLDGTGEIIQVVDTGLDETSCFFADGDGQEIPHGYYFEELSEGGFRFPTSQGDYYYYTSQGAYPYSYVPEVFEGGDFSFDLSRRKVVQYIDLVNKDSPTSSFSYGGVTYPFLPPDGFGEDDPAGHGTHTGSTAAGSAPTSPAETTACDADQDLSCAGGCIDATYSTDDLVSYSFQRNFTIDIDRQCPMFGCDEESEPCLGDDVGVTLAENGGIAQGAKLAIFDIAAEEAILADNPGNGLWEPCLEAGCKIHSNSWGGFICATTALDILYDEFMYNNPENLLIFAAGNDGQNSLDQECTIGAPTLAKNALAIGATSSGETRVNGEEIYDIDVVASFSSFGPAPDGRIKPDLVAPGDHVYAAASDGTDLHSCRLWAYAGTSMSAPVVAGSAAMVRQYFADEDFYTADVTARGFCGGGFLCEGFSPSSATVKALLINSANLMGGPSEPDGFRGFGRVHLEMGLPLDGEDDLALYVADSSGTSIGDSSEREYRFDVDADAGLDFRATLCWIDPPTTTFAGVQLVHDLDLSVVSPSGTTFTMWSTGLKDTLNVNERVVVDAADVESGTWTVLVSSNVLTAADEQSYSLVVNGAISPADGGVTDTENAVDSIIDDDDSAAGVRAASGLSVAVGTMLSITAALCMA